MSRIAKDLAWTALGCPDLETVMETLGGEPAPTVVDFKVKSTPGPRSSRLELGAGRTGQS